jgi:hypothetical protein
MKRILIALAGVALIVGLGIPAALPASASSFPTWCGSWDPNPALNTMTHVVTENGGAGPDGSAWYIYRGQSKSNGVYYVWAYLTHAKPGDQIAFLWQYNNNLGWYQCGNAQSDRTATVASGNTVTWTSGVPVSSVVQYGCQLWAVNNTTSYC